MGSEIPLSCPPRDHLTEVQRIVEPKSVFGYRRLVGLTEGGKRAGERLDAVSSPTQAGQDFGFETTVRSSFGLAFQSFELQECKVVEAEVVKPADPGQDRILGPGRGRQRRSRIGLVAGLLQPGQSMLPIVVGTGRSGDLLINGGGALCLPESFIGAPRPVVPASRVAALRIEVGKLAP